MHRLIVLILAAVDAVIAAAVGLAAALAPLTLVWVLAGGGVADWNLLWPASAKVWQLGHLVPLTITLPPEYLAATGIDAAAASFVLSLAPLAFAVFTAVFAARSGRRASQAGAWVTGVVTAPLLFTAIAAGVAITSHIDVASTVLWTAILFPGLVFAAPALIGALVTEWSEATDGALARVRDRLEGTRWGEVPALIARGTAVVLVALAGCAALLTAIALIMRGGEVIALFESSHVDALGATLMTLGQLAYLPTVVVWALSFLAGPGFVIGTGTTVSPAGTQLGVLPGVPLLGAVPESLSPWLLLLALLPVAAGACAGWIVRSRLVARRSSQDEVSLSATADDVGVRVVATLAIAVLSAAVVALLAALASGSFGPGTLADVGPEPRPLALAVGLEVLVGAAILLISPARRREDDPHTAADDVDAAVTVDAPPVD